VHLFDLLLTEYDHVVVDASSRVDSAMMALSALSDAVLLVVQPEITSVWNARRLGAHLGNAGTRKMQLVLNRDRKVPGLSEGDLEDIIGVKILSRIPNQYSAVTTSIELGIPVCLNQSFAISKSFARLVMLLVETTVADEVATAATTKKASFRSWTTAPATLAAEQQA